MPSQKFADKYLLALEQAEKEKRRPCRPGIFTAGKAIDGNQGLPKEVGRSALKLYFCEVPFRGTFLLKFA